MIEKFIPVNIVRKFNNFKLLLSVIYYRKMFTLYCKTCGQKIRVYKPISVKGLEYISIGNNFKLDFGGIIEAWDNHNYKIYNPEIIIGSNVSLGKRCHIGCTNKIVIGDNVLVGSNVLIIDHNHGRTSMEEMNISPNNRELYSKGPIIIEDNVWIGENVTILSGVTVGKGTVIGANSVVTKNIDAYCVAGGNPARIIKRIEKN